MGMGSRPEPPAPQPEEEKVELPTPHTAMQVPSPQRPQATQADVEGESIVDPRNPRASLLKKKPEPRDTQLRHRRGSGTAKLLTCQASASPPCRLWPPRARSLHWHKAQELGAV